MLVDIQLDTLQQTVTELVDKHQLGHPQRGVYICINIPTVMWSRTGDSMRWDYPKNLPGLAWCYGVCDSIEQFTARWLPGLEADPRNLYVTLDEMWKEDQPEWGGWRWHKWGPYIGDQTPTCEYLYDEPIVECVCIYHVYEAPPKYIVRE